MGGLDREITWGNWTGRSHGGIGQGEISEYDKNINDFRSAGTGCQLTLDQSLNVVSGLPNNYISLQHTSTIDSSHSACYLYFNVLISALYCN